MNDEQENSCDICAHDHETRECDVGLCGSCYEVVDNCDCDVCDEITAAEWIDLGSPLPKSLRD